MMEFIQIAAGLLLFLFGGWAALRIRKLLADSKMKRRFAVGSKAEKDAVFLLERHGYSVLKGQATSKNVFYVDGEKTSSTVRADYLAEKNGQRFVVEVKSGDAVPNPTHSATRRQLLEYEHVFRPDGLILADMTAGALKRVAFGLNDNRINPDQSHETSLHPTQQHQPLPRWKHVSWALVAGIILGIIAANLLTTGSSS